MKRQFSRRHFLNLARRTALTAAGIGLVPQIFNKTLLPESVVYAATGYDLYFAGTDGWGYFPSPALPPYHPDTLAPSPFTTYIFGFRNVTGLSDDQRINQRNKAQHNAPFFWASQEQELKVQLTNLGLALRPDLTDAHTIHWHGFRNVIPFFDGEPTGSVSVRVGTLFTYVFRPHDPGTYMYHCHVEDVEHVTMGMTGLVFVRPIQNGNTALYASGKYAYNDGDGSTGYDREYALFSSEIWMKGHWNDAHIQESDWSEFKADFSLLNGRVYPDTLLPNSPINQAATIGPSAHALTVQTDINGDLKTNPGLERLQYNPHSSLITCNAGERVLMRFANLGFREQAMTLAGLQMKVVGRDATLMRSMDGTDTSYLTNTILLGAGESFDTIFVAPAYQGPGPYDTYILYNRRYTQDSNLSTGGAGGQRTEIRVYPAGSLRPQRYLNEHPNDIVG